MPTPANFCRTRIAKNAQYTGNPTLKCSWDPDQLLPPHNPTFNHRSRDNLGSHPPSPTAQSSLEQSENEQPLGPNAKEWTTPGQKIYTYPERDSTHTFWRFPIRIQLADREMGIQYSIDDGMKTLFFVPGSKQTMRLAAYSCNGFHADVRPNNFCGPGFQCTRDHLWSDLLEKHRKQPFHVLVGGGDQLYCDGITNERELQTWKGLPRQQKMQCLVTPVIPPAIDRFYFNHYCEMFRSGAFARANRSIPMLNMLGDHDILDGYGSCPDNCKQESVFNKICTKGYFFFLLFQCFIVSSDGKDDRPNFHFFKSLIIGGPGKHVLSPSHSFLSPVGPTVWILMLDCRAERNLNQVCGEYEYLKVFNRLYGLPREVEHLIIQLGVPIAYPRMVFLESILASKFKRLAMLLPALSGLKGSVNKYDANAELLDDLMDRWTSKHHKKERNEFIIKLQRFAERRRVRISFLTGDVHCAAVGMFKTLQKGKKHTAPLPEKDHRYMLDIVTSAIVNIPPPIGALTLVNKLSRRQHVTMYDADTVEEMYPLFSQDTNGSNQKNRYFMGRRNWCSITLDSLKHSPGLLFHIRVEKENGRGDIVEYTVRAPPPKWTTGSRSRGWHT